MAAWSKARRPYYIPGYANGKRQPFKRLWAAKKACLNNDGCGGVTLLRGWYELRKARHIVRSPVAHETSWLKE